MCQVAATSLLLGEVLAPLPVEAHHVVYGYEVLEHEVSEGVLPHEEVMELQAPLHHRQLAVVASFLVEFAAASQNEPVLVESYVATVLVVEVDAEPAPVVLPTPTKFRHLQWLIRIELEFNRIDSNE